MTTLTRNHDELAAQIRHHIAGEPMIGFWAWFEGQYGIPAMLMRVCEDICEHLPSDERRAFFAALPGAVAGDGKDLSRVVWAFLASELRALPSVPDEVQAAIDLVIAGMDLLAAGEKWPDAVGASTVAATIHSAIAHTAAYSAYAAAVAHILDYAAAAYAADAAAYAVDAAADAADTNRSAVGIATRIRQRDTLLRLITEAPVMGASK